MEVRMRRHDGEYRWFLYQLNPLRDEQGRVSRWCGVRTDIDEQKRAQDRTQRENLVLREEVDKASMFEEMWERRRRCRLFSRVYRKWRRASPRF